MYKIYTALKAIPADAPYLAIVQQILTTYGHQNRVPLMRIAEASDVDAVRDLIARLPEPSYHDMVAELSRMADDVIVLQQRCWDFEPGFKPTTDFIKILLTEIGGSDGSTT